MCAYDVTKAGSAPCASSIVGRLPCRPHTPTVTERQLFGCLLGAAAAAFGFFLGAGCFFAGAARFFVGIVGVWLGDVAVCC